MKKTFRHTFSEMYNQETVIDNEVLTIPNQAISVTEIKRRLRAGIAVPTKNMTYSDNPIPRFRVRSVTDIAQARKAYEDYVNNLNMKVKQMKTLKSKKDENAA